MRPTTRHLIGYSSLLLAVLLLGWVSYDIWQTINQPLQSVGKTIDVDRPHKQAPSFKTKDLVKAHLFGNKVTKTKKPPRVVVAPQTRLKLKLVGIFASGQNNKSLALIETPNRKQQVVAIDQTIDSSDAILKDVLDDRVLIERNGKLEQLMMVRPKITNKKSG